MKSWRTLIAVTAVLFMASGAFAGGKCFENTDLTLVWPVTQCPGFHDETNTSVGNGFPWENSTFIFSSFRNQYLYNNAALKANASDILNGVGARGSSFIGGSVNMYGSFSNGDPSTVIASTIPVDTLVPTFAANAGIATELARLEGTNASPLNISTYTGPGGSTVSVCASCPGASEKEQNEWLKLSGVLSMTDGVMFDQTAAVAPGNSGAGVWDTDSTNFGGGCTPAGTRAFGSGSFANPNWLTTALGVDGYDFVWVLEASVPPPAATVQQQIAEIVRLLLTPQGLRCSYLDMTPGNAILDDDPVAFPGGKDIDVISAQVGSDGFVTGDELRDAAKKAGFNP